MTIAERLREYRKQPPYPSLRTVAEDVGLNAGYLSQIERGLKIPKGKTLERLGKLFGMSAAAIRESGGAVRILQISAAAVEGEIRVACLLSDGTITMAYPERSAGQC